MLLPIFFTRGGTRPGARPAAQQILFGGLYRDHVDYAGRAHDYRLGKQVQSDEVICTVRGTSSESQSKCTSPATPPALRSLVKVPLAMGKFSMELVR